MNEKTVIICPLDWGIGHATRCVPVIGKFLDAGYRVIIGSDGRPYEFLRKEFPGLKLIRFPGTKVRYRKNVWLPLKMLSLAPGFLIGIRQEHRFLKKLIREEQIDVIVSDNRYGLWNKDCYSVILTHQLCIQLPFPLGYLHTMVNRINRHFTEKFDELWIPDFEQHRGLAGLLSHPDILPANAFFLGPLSRFSSLNSHPDLSQEPYDVMFMLSGPETQRTIFEEIIFRQLENTSIKAIIVRGKTEESDSYEINRRIKVFSHLETPVMKEYLINSLIVVCRPGYSSIMDLVTLGKRAIFVPTPGQPEQEYLARYLMDKKIYFSMEQKNFDILYALEMSRNYPGMIVQNDYKMLEERVRTIMNRD